MAENTSGSTSERDRNMTDFTMARQAMVDCQVRPSDVTQYPIIEAMLWAPREQFVPAALREIAYAESEIPLGDGRVLLAARTFAKMLEAASVGADDLVLDLAPGTGYSSAVLSRLAAAVVAVEPNETYQAQAVENFAALDVDNVIISTGDPVAGDAGHGPYDVILINGAVERVSPDLLDQLKDGGRLVAIFGDGVSGQCRVVVKAGNSTSNRYVFDATAPILGGFANEKEFAF